MAETGTPPGQSGRTKPETTPVPAASTPAAPAPPQKDAQPQQESPPPKKPKHLRTKVLETGFSIAGFGNVLRAWRAEGNRFKNVAKSLGKKFADMAAGSLVSMSFRLIAITWVAGIIGGVTTFGALGLLALATGAASGVYTYAKAYAGDKLKLPRDQRHTVRFFDRARARRAAVAFGTGFLSGGVGLWLAKTEIVQSAIGAVRDFCRPATEVLTEPFNSAAARPAASPAPEARVNPAVHAAPLAPRFAAALEVAADSTAAPDIQPRRAVPPPAMKMAA